MNYNKLSVTLVFGNYDKYDNKIIEWITDI